MTLSISTLLIHCPRRTILQFLRGVPHGRSGDSLTDQGERAKVGHPFGIDRLEWLLGFNGKEPKEGKTNASFRSLHLLTAVAQLQPNVSGAKPISRETHTQSLLDVFRGCLAI